MGDAEGNSKPQHVPEQTNLYRKGLVWLERFSDRCSRGVSGRQCRSPRLRFARREVALRSQAVPSARRLLADAIAIRSRHAPPGVIQTARITGTESTRRLAPIDFRLRAVGGALTVGTDTGPARRWRPTRGVDPRRSSDVGRCCVERPPPLDAI